MAPSNAPPLPVVKYQVDFEKNAQETLEPRELVMFYSFTTLFIGLKKQVCTLTCNCPTTSFQSKDLLLIHEFQRLMWCLTFGLGRFL